jgi:hypothetical protein
MGRGQKEVANDSVYRAAVEAGVNKSGDNLLMPLQSAHGTNRRNSSI